MDAGHQNDLRTAEPRIHIWAIAEVSWKDDSGASRRIRGTLEDTSRSGACVRIKNPIQVGSLVNIKWHREQFSAVARNCRSDGREYLLGVLRQTAEQRQAQATPAAAAAQPLAAAPEPPPVPPSSQPLSEPFARTADRPASGHERNPMQPKNLFPKFWRQQSEAAGPEKSVPMEAAVNKSTSPSAEAVAPHAHLLTYEDIYHAAGILSPTSGYGIPKLSEMLNSERIRDLSKDVKRASILMALDASGTSVDDVLQDATRRQNALDTYETAQRRQLEEFEARKAQENAQIEAEMERLKAHYTERIQHNHDLVEQQREALRNWRMATQNESQRIAEVIDICQKPGTSASAAAASAGGERKSSDALSAESRNLRPSLITRD